MEPHFTENEDVEKVKRWWREYGRSIVIGVVVGLLIMAGVRAWMAHQEETAQTASALYAQLTQAVSAENDEAALDIAQRLEGEYGSTPYADLAAFVSAQLKVDAGTPAEAIEPLQGVVEGGATEELRQIARLRLARVLLAVEQPDEALEVLAGTEPGAFSAHYDLVRGDIHTAQNRPRDAREAYDRALSALPEDDPTRRAVQMKRDDLPVGTQQAAGEDANQ